MLEDTISHYSTWSKQFNSSKGILKTLGDFPKIHSLKDLIDVCENNCLRNLVDEKWYIVDVLEDAYIGGRHFIKRYNPREYEESSRFVEEVFKCIGISNT